MVYNKEFKTQLAVCLHILSTSLSESQSQNLEMMTHFLILIGPIHTVFMELDICRPTIVERCVLWRFAQGAGGDAAPAKQLIDGVLGTKNVFLNL